MMTLNLKSNKSSKFFLQVEYPQLIFFYQQLTIIYTQLIFISNKMENMFKHISSTEAQELALQYLNSKHLHCNGIINEASLNKHLEILTEMSYETGFEELNAKELELHLSALNVYLSKPQQEIDVSKVAEIAMDLVLGSSPTSAASKYLVNNL